MRAAGSKGPLIAETKSFSYSVFDLDGCYTRQDNFYLGDNVNLPHIVKDYATEKGVAITLHENRFFSMKFNGYFHYLDALKFSGAVVTVPRFSNGDLLLVRLRRTPVVGFSLEFPRGALESGEAPAAAARRELGEETGYDIPASAIQHLGKTAPESGTLNMLWDVYSVDIPDDVIAGTYDTEEIDRPIRVTEKEFRSMVKNGEITCATTVAAYTLLKLHAED